MEYKGRAASRGVRRGTARVIASPVDIFKVSEGDVLVCQMTTPEWTEVFGRIAGVVTEVGGILCHAAIVAREYKIPAVLSIKDAMTLVKDGDTVEVDGDNGVVRVLTSELVEAG